MNEKDDTFVPIKLRVSASRVSNVMDGVLFLPRENNLQPILEVSVEKRKLKHALMCMYVHLNAKFVKFGIHIAMCELCFSQSSLSLRNKHTRLIIIICLVGILEEENFISRIIHVGNDNVLTTKN